MKNWLMFGALGLIWGSSFLLIKIGLLGLDPFSLVALRISTGAVAFAIFIILTGRKIPRDRATLFKLAIVGVMNIALPFILITWGESSIDSGLAGVLDATVPLFSLVIAHLALEDDKMSLGKLLGLITGFCGIIILGIRSGDPTHPNPLVGQAAVVVAAISYAGSAVYIRRYLRGVDPVIVPAGSSIIAAMVMLLLVGFTVRPLPDFGVLAAQHSDALWAVLVLGILNTFIAYIFYFSLIANWGASRSTMVTYLLPPISLLLGKLFNQEQLDFWIILATILIVGGIGLANLWKIPSPQIDGVETSKAA